MCWPIKWKTNHLFDDRHEHVLKMKKENGQGFVHCTPYPVNVTEGGTQNQRQSKQTTPWPNDIRQKKKKHPPNTTLKIEHRLEHSNKTKSIIFLLYRFFCNLRALGWERGWGLHPLCHIWIQHWRWHSKPQTTKSYRVILTNAVANRLFVFDS